MSKDSLLTTADLGARYHVDPSTIRYWRHVGKGPRGFKVGKRVLYRESEVLRWEREQEAKENGDS